MAVKINLMLLLAPNSRINCSMFVKKDTTLDFCQIRLTHIQSISNMGSMAVKQQGSRIMLVTVLDIKQSRLQRLNAFMDITVASKCDQNNNKSIRDS